MGRDVFQSLLDGDRDRWWSGESVSGWLVSVLVGDVGDLDLFVFGGQELKLAGDGFDGLLGSLGLDVTLFLGRYPVVSLISKEKCFRLSFNWVYSENDSYANW